MTGAWPASVRAPDGPPGPIPAPLLLTAALPPALAAVLAEARRTLDPARAARTPPHLTLFRHLPGPELLALLADIRAMVRGQPAPAFRLDPPRATRGAAMARVRSDALDALRAALAERWHGLLAPGDVAPPLLHVTLGRGRPEGAPLPALPAGPHRVPALLLWAHGGEGQRDEPRWTPLVAIPFRR
jgi:hypothetical protein